MNGVPDEDALPVVQTAELLQADDVVSGRVDDETISRVDGLTSNVQLAIGDTATKLSAIAGILIQRPKQGEAPGDLPSWATTSSASLNSPRNSLFCPGSAFLRRGAKPVKQDSTEEIKMSSKELREIIFLNNREKKIIQGLKADILSRQTLVSSFSVGVAIGSVVAILVKVFRDFALSSLF